MDNLDGSQTWSASVSESSASSRATSKRASDDHGYTACALLRAVGVWSAYGPELAARLSRTVCDLGSRKHWQYAAWVLRDLAESELPRPVGDGALNSVFRGAVDELLAALHGREGDREALADRDLPALQRLRTLVSPSSEEGRRPEVFEAVAAQLAPEPLLVAERAELLARLVDPIRDPAALPGRLRDLADVLEGTGASVAAHTAGWLHMTWALRTRPEHAGPVLTAADGLARDGGLAAGLLAAEPVARTGAFLGWPEEWRSLLRLLRAHPHPDVRRGAYKTMTVWE